MNNESSVFKVEHDVLEYDANKRQRGVVNKASNHRPTMLQRPSSKHDVPHGDDGQSEWIEGQYPLHGSRHPFHWPEHARCEEHDSEYGKNAHLNEQI